MEIFASAIAAAILMAMAMLVHWVLKKRFPKASWRISVVVTVLLLFALSAVAGLIDRL